ncbi:hypothetical protein OUZ56_007320 [Daphnia magna]|uniref:Uncharacterized protein n=1 Tax=Daphnia magna TaxID=35525 RepID=A0ABQ9YZH9_9CRUS|nr:hypothetical protein OUZ56_007320 [Daphnia magna]
MDGLSQRLATLDLTLISKFKRGEIFVFSEQHFFRFDNGVGLPFVPTLPTQQTKYRSSLKRKKSRNFQI